LPGRFSGKVLKSGEHIVPEAALAALAQQASRSPCTERRIEIDREQIVLDTWAFHGTGMSLHRFYWAAWLTGTALIVLSWARVVTPTVGWIGFTTACGAALLSYIPRRSSPPASEDWAVLTTAMLESKDRSYESVIQHLRGGKPPFMTVWVLVYESPTSLHW
jgi:hypothetical protein